MRLRWSPPPARITASVTRPGTSGVTAAGPACCRASTATATVIRFAKPKPRSLPGGPPQGPPHSPQNSRSSIPAGGHTLRWIMRCILVCPDDFLWRLVADSGEPRLDPLYLVESARARTRIVQRGGDALTGDLERDGVIALGMDGVTERFLEPALERALTRARVERVRAHFASAERVLIMMQDDPDPDAIASALALRAVLGRNKTAAPIATFGTITRPENRAMTRILEIDVELIKPRAVEEYDMVAMVDAQPSFFEEPFERVDLVIDHHPEETPVRAVLKDLRPGYGATATILTEYLRAVDARVSQRLATALLYGIKADTQHLERGATRADLEAFAFVHGLANHSALRRIERPELPNEALDVLARGIAGRHVQHGVVFSHLGAVAYPELVAQFADFFLQVEGAEWSVVSGTVHGELHISVRNVGWVRAAGDVVRP